MGQPRRAASWMQALTNAGLTIGPLQGGQQTVNNLCGASSGRISRRSGCVMRPSDHDLENFSAGSLKSQRQRKHLPSTESGLVRFLPIAMITPTAIDKFLIRHYQLCHSVHGQAGKLSRLRVIEQLEERFAAIINIDLLCPPVRETVRGKAVDVQEPAARR